MVAVALKQIRFPFLMREGGNRVAKMKGGGGSSLLVFQSEEEEENDQRHMEKGKEIRPLVYSFSLKGKDPSTQTEQKRKGGLIFLHTPPAQRAMTKKKEKVPSGSQGKGGHRAAFPP